jgi:acyl-CoA thioesterase YciA
VAVKHLLFLQPIFIYDTVSFYTAITALGRTSITVSVVVYAQRYENNEIIKVSDALLVYVAVSEPGKARPIPKEK